MFKIMFGILVACDVNNLKDLKELIEATSNLQFIAGYKIGASLPLLFGFEKVNKIIKNISTLPIIYDHQKYGTDIPSISANSTFEVIKDSNVDGLIIFPQAGIETLKKTVEACFNSDITPIVGGEMTHRGYLKKEGGYINNDAPKRMYLDAIHLGVTHFIVPGNKPKSIEEYTKIIKDKVSNPIFLFPGVGKGQGGDITAAFKIIYPSSAFAIVGRGIYMEPNYKEAASKIWTNIAKELGI